MQHLTSIRRAAFTLLEMVVVLTILAAVSVIAARSLTRVGDQARFESTQHTLRDVRSAILGDNNAAALSSTPSLTGYFADLGRLPTGLNNSEIGPNGPRVNLNELVEPCGAPAYGPFVFNPSVKAAIGVQLYFGWRGPYMQLPIGTSANIQGGYLLEPLDGWGHNFQSKLNTNPLQASKSVDIYSNGQPLDSGNNAQEYTGLLIATIQPNDSVGTSLSCRIRNAKSEIPKTPTGADLQSYFKVVRFYPVYPQFPALTDAGITIDPLPVPVDQNTGEFNFKSTTQPQIGPQAIRVQFGNDGFGPPVYFTVFPGASINIDLTVPDSAS